jgi:two-component system sensor histidine kinase PrrB
VAKNVRILIDDSGSGIPPDERERVFEAFFRGANAHVTDGAGLGMAIAREQARMIGGDILIESNGSGGARLIVDLPVEGVQ